MTKAKARDVIAWASGGNALRAPPFPQMLGYPIADTALAALEKAGLRIVDSLDDPNLER